MSRTFKHKKILGRDISHLKHKTSYEGIPVVKNRVLHIDGDFLAYMVAYDPTKSITEMQHNCDAMVERLRSQSGSEKVVIHLTHKDSDKGNRYNIAMLKEYQDNRRKKEKPKYLHLIRDWMADERGAKLYKDREADDGMAIAAYADQKNTVLATKDKDLCMIPGLQINWDTGVLSQTKDDFGWIELVEGGKKTKTYKVKGRGWKFFWAQLLMGDTADNIQGLPWVIHEVTNGKAKRIGAVTAYNILKGVKTNREAFMTVKKLFRDGEQKEPYRNYRIKKPKKGVDKGIISWSDAMKSEMKLLWMRRKNDENDVIEWLKEFA